MFKEIGHVALRVKDYEAMQDFYKAYDVTKRFYLTREGNEERIGYFGLKDGHFIEMFPVHSGRHHGFTGDNEKEQRSFQYAVVDDTVGEIKDVENNEWVGNSFKGIVAAVFKCRKYEEMVKFYQEIMRLNLVKKEDDEAVFELPSHQCIILKNEPYEGDNNTLNKAVHHLALLCDDILEEAKWMEDHHIELSHGTKKLNPVYTQPYADICKIGSDGSYAFYFSDPEDNDFEAMQYTKDSLQLKFQIK